MAVASLKRETGTWMIDFLTGKSSLQKSRSDEDADCGGEEEETCTTNED